VGPNPSGETVVHTDLSQTGLAYFDQAKSAHAAILALYQSQIAFLRESFRAFVAGSLPEGRVRAFYPMVRFATKVYGQFDSRLAFGFVPEPGVYETTITRPDLFERYLVEQFALLLRNHGEPIGVGLSDTPIPIHFAYNEGLHLEAGLTVERLRDMRDVFDLPDLIHMDDSIVNGTYEPPAGTPRPLALFTAPRTDFSLHRLRHYTGTDADKFQNFVLLTNYQFYVDEFVNLGRKLMESGSGDYDTLVEPGNRTTPNARTGSSAATGELAARLPQMPAYHLTRPDHSGITLVNIGVGPSNAKTITDHIAVLRPHAWLMLGHCAGLRHNQRLGDFVLAHGYVREDHVLDADLPTWVPIPPLAEIQVALEQAVAEVTGLSGYELKSVMRTGTVASVDNRNWELRHQREPVERFTQSRAIAVDMESATIATNGFRFRVPYGTLLCVSDKPLHGEIKLPGMADAFYRAQVDQHLKIGIATMERLRALGQERLHSRKLRAFTDAAFH
jgi:AMP nucleosidase